MCDHAPDTASSVNREGLDGIVNLSLLENFRRSAVHNAADEAHKDGCPRMDVTAARGDRHQTPKDPAAHVRHIPRLGFQYLTSRD